MTSGHVQEGGTWTFAEAFHWSVWVALGGTAIFVSITIALVEHFTYGIKNNKKGQ